MVNANLYLCFHRPMMDRLVSNINIGAKHCTCDKLILFLLNVTYIFFNWVSVMLKYIY